MPERGAPNPVLAHILAELGDARRVLDLGCGAGGLLRALARRGFAVSGADPQPAMIARAGAACPGAYLVPAGAEDLPFADASADAAIFLNALHHVPAAHMDRAVAEAARCIRPGGRLVVVEPLAEGPLFEVLRGIDDETAIRGLAQDALDRCGLAPCRDVTFERRDRHEGADAFMDRLVAADPGRAAAAGAARDAIRAALAQWAERDGETLILRQPMRLRSFAV